MKNGSLQLTIKDFFISDMNDLGQKKKINKFGSQEFFFCKINRYFIFFIFIVQDLKREVIINFKLKIDLFPFIVCQLNFTPDAAVPEKQNIFFGLVILALGP